MKRKLKSKIRNKSSISSFDSFRDSTDWLLDSEKLTETKTRAAANTETVLQRLQSEQLDYYDNPYVKKLLENVSQHSKTHIEQLSNEFETSVNRICNQIKDLLISKNKKYGDSALNPIKIFAKESTVSAIRVRIDDKLNRIKNSNYSDDTEDTVLDLIGYLILLRIAEESKKE